MQTPCHHISVWRPLLYVEPARVLRRLAKLQCKGRTDSTQTVTPLLRTLIASEGFGQDQEMQESTLLFHSSNRNRKHLSYGDNDLLSIASGLRCLVYLIFIEYDAARSEESMPESTTAICATVVPLQPIVLYHCTCVRIRCSTSMGHLVGQGACCAGDLM